MSLRSLALLIEDSAEHRSVEGSISTGLFFVLNSKFLRPFHVLTYSLIKNRSLLDLPVVVISEDSTVQDDPVVRQIADRMVIAGAKDIAQFSKISGRSVIEKLQLDWIAKYTFLKWLIFEDFGYERHVYLDADILCLNPCNELTRMRESDLYAGPVFQRTLTRNEEGSLSLAEKEENMRSFLNQETWKSLNSGVLVLNKKLLNSAFREQLIKLAELLEVTVEQSVIRRYLADNPEYSQRLFSPLYNFNHGFVAQLSVQTQIELLKSIKLLHYAGADKKPWNSEFVAEERRSVRITDSLWNAYANEAQRAHRVFRKAQERLATLNI